MNDLLCSEDKLANYDFNNVDDPYELNVTNKGGVDARLSILWVDVASASSGSPDRFHGYFNLTQLNIVVLPGSSISVSWNSVGTLNSLDESYNPPIW